MFGVSRETVKRLREELPAGTRIECLYMDDVHSKAGMKGTVEFVDDAGGIHTVWDDGSSLALVYGEDGYRKL